MQVADVLAGDVVGGVPLLAITCLVDAQDEGGLANRLAQQLQPSLPERIHRPFGIGQKVMQGLRIGVDRLAQPRQGLATGLGQEAQMQDSELLKMPHVPEQVAIPRAVVVDEGYRWGSWARLAHAEASFRWLRPTGSIPNMTEEGLDKEPSKPRP
jgi:hypothetical protein